MENKNLGIQEWELCHLAALSSGECSSGVAVLGDPVLASAFQFERGSRGPEPGVAGFWDLRSQARPQGGSRLPLLSSFVVRLEGEGREKGQAGFGEGGGQRCRGGLLLGSQEPCLRAGSSLSI